MITPSDAINAATESIDYIDEAKDLLNEAVEEDIDCELKGRIKQFLEQKDPHEKVAEKNRW